MTAQERHDLVRKILRDPEISAEEALRRVKAIIHEAAPPASRLVARKDEQQK